MKLTSEDLNAFPTAIGARLFVRLMAILSPFSSVPSQYALIVIRVCYYRYWAVFTCPALLADFKDPIQNQGNPISHGVADYLKYYLDFLF